MLEPSEEQIDTYLAFLTDTLREDHVEFVDPTSKAFQEVLIQLRQSLADIVMVLEHYENQQAVGVHVDLHTIKNRLPSNLMNSLHRSAAKLYQLWASA